MILHDFHAICPKEHKRNFVWATDHSEELAEVKSRCVICNKEVYFKVINYWQEPCEESKFKIK